MGKEFSDVFAQALKKVFGEKVRAAETNHIRISSSIPSSKAAPGPLNRHNLGVLPLSNHVSTTVPLDRNTQCTLTPTLLESGTVQIILTMETTGADGKPVGMNVARVVAHPGEPFDVSIGSLDLAFTPQIAEQ
ncbi:MAG TPA: hypothetical protein VMA35_13995 [Candidatus Sulfopaludibacter sp.]|nr:hypothetical protein [Candidatus Sulfopaludibacter sp.]